MHFLSTLSWSRHSSRFEQALISIFQDVLGVGPEKSHFAELPLVLLRPIDFELNTTGSTTLFCLIICWEANQLLSRSSSTWATHSFVWSAKNYARCFRLTPSGCKPIACGWNERVAVTLRFFAAFEGAVQDVRAQFCKLIPNVSRAIVATFGPVQWTGSTWSFRALKMMNSDESATNLLLAGCFLTV